MVFKKLSEKQKLRLLGVLVVLQIFIAIGLWTAKATTIPYAYLIKHGHQYLVIWREPNSEFIETNSYPTLNAALTFAGDVLGLSVGSNPRNADELEKVWIQERAGQFALLWKTSRYNFLNRLTFQKEGEAQVFQTAFRNGAYTAGPFGHSIFLRPSRVQ